MYPVKKTAGLLRTNMDFIEIAGRKVGPDYPCFIIAEAGVNHNGDVEIAKRLVDVAAEAKVDAVKFQTFKADCVVSNVAPKAEYQLQTTNGEESQLEMLQRLELSPDAHLKLRKYCKERGVLFISTPFDTQSCDLLDKFGVPVFKIGSGEITNWPFLEYVARKDKPIILSTGMSFLSEVDEAVRVIRNVGNDKLALLHCVSNYPADPSDANLQAIQTMATAFRLPVGYSDHTPSIEVSLAAVALGACVIEKHFTLDRNLPGPDHSASLEPQELKALVAGIRTIERALGSGAKEPAKSEADNRMSVRRSLVAAVDIPAGTILTKDMIDIKRPGTGLKPAILPHLVGLTVREFVPGGAMFTLEVIEVTPPLPYRENREVIGVTPPPPSKKSREVVGWPQLPSQKKRTLEKFEKDAGGESPSASSNKKSREVPGVTPPPPSKKSREVVG